MTMLTTMIGTLKRNDRMTSLTLPTITPQLYIGLCLIVAALDVYISIKLWNMYYGDTQTNSQETAQEEQND